MSHYCCHSCHYHCHHTLMQITCYTIARLQVQAIAFHYSLKSHEVGMEGLMHTFITDDKLADDVWCSLINQVMKQICHLWIRSTWWTQNRAWLRVVCLVRWKAFALRLYTVTFVVLGNMSFLAPCTMWSSNLRAQVSIPGMIYWVYLSWQWVWTRRGICSSRMTESVPICQRLSLDMDQFRIHAKSRHGHNPHSSHLASIPARIIISSGRGNALSGALLAINNMDSIDLLCKLGLEAWPMRIQLCAVFEQSHWEMDTIEEEEERPLMVFFPN